MSNVKSVGITRTATGTMVSEACVITKLGIMAGADAATVTFRDGGATGPIRWSLGAGIGLSDGADFGENGLRFLTDCHVTVTGTTPNAHVAVTMPQARQANAS